MKITDSCICGSKFSVQDEYQHYCQTQHKKFLEVHEQCRKVYIKNQLENNKSIVEIDKKHRQAIINKIANNVAQKS